jgi:glycosyltransferase involved in cell wall biosynthesis
MASKRSVLLVGHHSPAIHGQAIQYSQLISGSKNWDDTELVALNAVYSESRDDLSGLSLYKIVRMFGYMVQMCWQAWHVKPELIIISPAFHYGAFLKDSIFILVAKKICRTRVIAWIHMDPLRLDIESRPQWFQRYARGVIKQLDLLVSCSHSLAKSWPDFLQSRPVKSISNGVPDAYEPPQITTCKSRKTIIGYLSALDRKKGWRELFNVALELCDNAPELEFRFYGGIGAGEIEEEVKQIFSASRHHSRIVWRGEAWGDDKHLAFSEMDLFCFPSHTKAFPLVVLEALSYSLPVVASDVGAVSDALVAERGGWLCPAEDEQELLACLNKAIVSQERWLSMGVYNRNRFLKQYSVNAFVDNWHQVIIEEVSG